MLSPLRHPCTLDQKPNNVGHCLQNPEYRPTQKQKNGKMKSESHQSIEESYHVRHLTDQPNVRLQLGLDRFCSKFLTKLREFEKKKMLPEYNKLQNRISLLSYIIRGTQKSMFLTNGLNRCCCTGKFFV